MDARNPTKASHKESSDGMEGDEGEDAMSMWAETTILVSNFRLCSYSGQEECASSCTLSFFT